MTKVCVTSGQGRIWAVSLIILLAICSRAFAEQNVSHSYFNALEHKLIQDGFDAQRIQNLFQSDQLVFETKGVTAYFQHNEATLDYDKMTTSSWISEARAYMSENAKSLQAAEKKFGVDPKVITAIILVETKFGRYLGNKSIISILSTMAALTEPGPREFLWTQLPTERRFDRSEYDQKADQKSVWAYRELKAFLTYTALHHIDPFSVVGSYAGAMGIAQFMPSNILTFGQDGNGDGRINLFDDADAIFSIASYLKNYGWKPGIDREQAAKAIYHYNHSKYYVNAILKIVDLLEGSPTK